jgi:predicted nucleic acid-binding protein
VGTVVGTTAFIDLERRRRRLPAVRAAKKTAARLGRALGEEEEVAIAAVTASELLHGVHQATAERVTRRGAFVETVLAAFPVLPFNLLCVVRASTRRSGHRTWHTLRRRPSCGWRAGPGSGARPRPGRPFGRGGWWRG